MYKLVFLFALSFLFFACDSKPKVIVEDAAPTNNATPEAAQENMTTINPSANEMHQVVALDIKETDRYTYLKVVEKSDTFWIASTKFEAKKGNQYFYKGGLLKTNFYSQEFDMTFDKIFLVSSIVDASAHPGSNGQMPTNANDATKVNPSEIKTAAGGVSLSNLFKEKSKYAGKNTLVSGKVVKVNSGIMNKNWIHIQDGQKSNGKPLDLTVTTLENIPLGAIVTLEGKITLDKDFGAGYKYDIIMEDAVVKK